MKEKEAKKMNQKEKLFFDQLKDIFIGAKIEGESGFINLMRIKSAYFDVIFKELNKEIEEKTKDFPDFKEEMFDKLYTFFKTYFSESGSIYFTYTPLKSKVYEKIYTPNKDVVLFWKTHMLYYVKTDRLWNNLTIDFDEDGVRYKINFDVSKLQHKKANEKREIIYELKEMKDKEITFDVLYSERGRKTKIDEILKMFKKKNIHLDEERLNRIFKIYERQNEVDYFINKNAEQFLKEQFNLWLKNYLFDDESDFNERRLKQLKVLKEIACKVIDFVAQFENELVKIWNKPKFALNSNYVITLDRIAKRDGGIKVIGKIVDRLIEEKKEFERNLDRWKKIKSNNESYRERFEEAGEIMNQIVEWYLLDLVDEGFNPRETLISTYQGKGLNPKYQFLPIDTKYFKDLELEILSLFDNLDKELDGWLIKSENYQALNTILPKFKEKVQTIYIDPPFNKEQDADYFYSVKYKDSTWITLLENRLQLAKDILKDTGSIFVRCDYNGNMYVRLLMNEIFGKENFRNEIILQRGMQTRKAEKRLLNKTDSLFFFFKSLEKGYLYILNREKEHIKCFNETLKVLKKVIDKETYEKVKDKLYESVWMPFLSMPGEQKTKNDREIFGVKLLPPKGRHWAFSQESLNLAIKNGLARLICKKCGNIVTNKNQLNNGKCPKCGSKDFEGQIYSLYNQINDNWTDIPGYEQDPNFPTRNSEILLKRVIESTSNEGDLVMDFFLGSGTTTAVAHKLKRKWIGVEMGGHFYSIVLPGMKKVLFYDPSQISKEKDVKEKYNKNNAGGFFKYYELEQYEQTLKKAVYKPSHPFVDFDDKSIYQQYVFMKDPKLLDAMKLDYENNTIEINFDEIYPKIDLAETLSNLTGKWIKKIEKNAVIFEDGSKIDFDDIDFKLIKPLIWW